MHSFLNSFSHVASCYVIAVHVSPFLAFNNGTMEQHLANEMLIPHEDGTRTVKTNYLDFKVLFGVQGLLIQCNAKGPLYFVPPSCLFFETKGVAKLRHSNAAAWMGDADSIHRWVWMSLAFQVQKIQKKQAKETRQKKEMAAGSVLGVE